MNQTRSHVQAALAADNDINKAMRNWNMDGDAESEWAAVLGGIEPSCSKIRKAKNSLKRLERNKNR